MAPTEENALDGRAPGFRWVAAGIWLVYLGQPADAIWNHSSGWQRIVGVAALVLFVLTYLAVIGRRSFFRMEPGDIRDLLIRWSLIGGLLCCIGLMIPGAGDASLTGMVFVSAAAMGLLVPKQGWAVMLALFAVTELSGRVVPDWSEQGNGFAVLLAGLAVWAARTALRRQLRLVAAERELREFALAEQRSHIARDLHDILGHSLTVISVKTELAERMLDVDPERTRSELRDLDRLTRDALADVRSTAAGIRGVSLPGEIASARSALDSAGIGADLPMVADEVPSQWRELFAWTIREAVTNVIRHSSATHCQVVLTATSVTVVDDGVGISGKSRGGRGLEGLADRTRSAGATLATGPGPRGNGFSVRVEAPA